GEEESDDLSKPTAPNRPDRPRAQLPIGAAVALVFAVAICAGLAAARFVVQKQANAARTAAAAAAKAAPPIALPPAVADTPLRQAREQFDGIMGGLLAGRYDADPELGPLARKLKGFGEWSVQSQKMTRGDAAEFRGTLTAGVRRARFAATVVRQPGGKW